MKLTWLLIGLAAAAAAIVGCSSTGASPDGGPGTGGSTGSGGLVIVTGEMGGRGMGGAQGTGGVGGGNRDGGDDASDGAAGDGGAACATAVANGACTGEGAVCGGSDCTDICQFCNSLRCTSGHWQPQEAVPAPCFSCGPSLRCQTNAQFCHAQMGGAVTNPPSYQCRATPAACRPTPTCLCLRNQNAAETLCAEGDAGTGQVTTTLLVP